MKPNKTNLRITLLTLVAISLFLTCKNPKNYDFLPALAKINLPLNIKVNTAEDLAFESNENYNENRFGLITARTLDSLITNWDKEKTPGISGKLVVIQVDTANSPGGRYVPSASNRGVYSYYLNYNSTAEPTTIFGQSRNNGIIETEAMVPEGKVTDAFLSTYGINPARDLIVIASDTSTQNNFLFSLRLVYALRYWGLDKRNVALLNGSVKQAFDAGEIFTTTNRNTEVKQESVSLKNTFTDSTILQATVADIIHILQNGNTTFEKVSAIPANGVQFVDARSANEYSPPNNTTGYTTPPTSKTCTTPPCKIPFDGRIKNAINLEWSNLLVNTGTNDFRFKSKAELLAIYSNLGLSKSKQIISYCDRGQRSITVLFAANSILGIASRLYDASWIEWGGLVYDVSGSWSTLAGSSAWRTDKSNRTDGLQIFATAANIAKYSFHTSNSYATSANKTIDTDKEYIRGTSSSGGGSGGSSSGSGGGNACGG
jgi:thiosulfate/3-mercaptopyruvate sulfurtransferase